MFLVLNILVLILHVSNINSFTIARKIDANVNDQTENSKLLKFNDGAHTNFSTSKPLFRSLRSIFNLSTKAPTTNLKQNDFNKMLSDEMFSVKQLLYDREKSKQNTPSLLIKQRWPIFELMSKLSDIKEGDDEVSDDLEIDVLKINKVNDTSSTTTETINNDYYSSTYTQSSAAFENKNESNRYLSKSLNMNHEQSNQKTSVDIMKEDTETDMKLNKVKENTQNTFESVPKKKAIDLRSLSEDPLARALRSSKTRTIKRLNHRCTASIRDARHTRQDALGTTCTSRQNHSPASEYPSTSCSHTTCSPTTCSPVSCSDTTCSPTTCAPTMSSLTTCWPTPCAYEIATKCYTNCVPVYPTMPPINAMQLPTYYMPYQYFSQQDYYYTNTMMETTTKRYKKKKKHKHKDKDEDDDLYYEDDSDYDYLEHGDDGKMQEIAISVDKEDREVVLKKDDVPSDTGCTRGIYDTDRNQFVNEVVNDLQLLYGDSVVKKCFCVKGAPPRSMSLEYIILLLLLLYVTA